MKIILSYLSIFFACMLQGKAQYADPYISISMRPPVVQIGATTTLEILEGNFGSNPICSNAMVITVSMGPNAEILGIAAGSDPRWSKVSLTTGPGNTMHLANTLGAFSEFDLAYIYLTVRAVGFGGPHNCGANITYIIANNPCAGGAPNAIHGNLEITNDNSVSSLTVPVSGTLPLHFTGFSVKDNGCSGSVSWITADEQDVNNFEVQQSFDGITFSLFKTVPSKGNGRNEYEIVVSQSQRRMYYRVVAVDIDYKKTYGSVQVLQLANCTKASLVKVFPIPAGINEKITIQSNANDKITYKLVDITGRIIQTGVFVRTTQLAVLNRGTYLLEMTSAGIKETQTISIQ